MAFKFIAVYTSVLLIQSALGQVLPASSTVSGNSVVTNDIYLNSASQLSNLGLPGIGGGLASLGSGLAGGSSGSGLAGASVGLAGASAGGLAAGSLGGITGTNVLTSPLVVTSVSPIGPSGLAVASENVLEGVLSVNGQLPFLSAVAFEGPLPTSGSGVATCGCGSGSIGIVSEGLPQAQAAPAVGLGLNRVY